MVIFITGAAGYVGQHLALYYLQQGHTVIGATRQDDFSVFNTLIQHQNFIPKTIQLNQPFSFSESVDIILHTAGQIHNADYFTHLTDNAITTQQVASFALEKNVSRLIYCSSISVYGKFSQPVITEQTDIVNPRAYGNTKYIGERLLQDIADQIPVSAFRLPEILGPGAYLTWIAQTLPKIRQHKAIETFYSPESLFNAITSINDLQRACDTVIEYNAPNFEAYVLSASMPISIKACLTLMIKHEHSNSHIINEEQLTNPFTLSTEKIEQCGFKPSSVKQMIQRYLANN